ncbi:DUF1638 domain-containing protein [Mariprofundus sp. KV]|uniref:DUF1638 domain-containing protein n=1 Tax=Mariprofundus sp. KV TaxID=2608715 RepID=UPI0015A43AA1|nr:DUF1638 domain-containing protein [Mariprofundus sp. KV]NWF35402.1 DUF1638 domain-containing protein [Mariprofundus sp. KV]
MAVTENAEQPERLLLIGCGILQKEIRYLIEKNSWQMDTSFMRSALHNNIGKLEKGLTGSLAKRADRETIVFYGCCHPDMDRIIEKGNSLRTPGQNCVDILLGRELFDLELERGAFFLLEEWAQRWSPITEMVFGKNPEVIRSVFQEAHKYILAIRTPCSDDFSEEAQEVASIVGLPLQWMDVGLEHLESTLDQTMQKKLKSR